MRVGLGDTARGEGVSSGNTTAPVLYKGICVGRLMVGRKDDSQNKMPYT